MKAKPEICTMQILLIAATASEIQPFAAVNREVDIMITGVGVPSTIYHLQKRIQQVGYDLIIQAGIAGCFNDKTPLGQSFLVKQDCFADIGIDEKENYYPVFKTEFADENEFPFTNGWLLNADENLAYSDLPAVKAITVNTVSDSERQKQLFRREFDAALETMEGAALHYVCLQENIPFVQIRSVSNYVGERDKTKWKIQEAIANLNTELCKLINRITN
jgi:futalosine hydrolase